MELNQIQITIERVWLKLVSILLIVLITACTTDEKIDNSLTSESSASLVLEHISIPATLQAEDYASKLGVETEVTSDVEGGENVAHINVDDFITYNITVPETGLYKMSFRVASRSNPSKFDVFQGTTKLTSITHPATGAWQAWETTSKTVELTEGDQTLRIVATGDLWNINWIQIIEERSDLPIPTTIQAEDYSNESGTETEVTTDIGGGENVGHIDSGDTLLYDIDVPSTGFYRLSFRVASRTTSALFEVYEGATLLSTVEHPATGNWQAWETTEEVSVYLEEGGQALRLISLSSGWNINWLKIEEVPREEQEDINLNLRVHIMQTAPWVHGTGVEMFSWVTPDDVNETIIPELNDIYSDTKVVWNVESIIEEPIVEFEGFQDSIDFVINTQRDAEGRSDPDRLPHLYDLMQPENRSTPFELDKNLFHIYLFPFIGSTSQGNAMRPFGYHSVVGTWTNKHNFGGVPEQTLLTEDQDAFDRGSLSRTIAHELGHVLDLAHSCDDCLMDDNGYIINEDQIEALEAEAIDRSIDLN